MTHPGKLKLLTSTTRADHTNFDQAPLRERIAQKQNACISELTQALR